MLKKMISISMAMMLVMGTTSAFADAVAPTTPAPTTVTAPVTPAPTLPAPVEPVVVPAPVEPVIVPSGQVTPTVDPQKSALDQQLQMLQQQLEKVKKNPQNNGKQPVQNNGKQNNGKQNNEKQNNEKQNNGKQPVQGNNGKQPAQGNKPGVNPQQPQQPGVNPQQPQMPVLPGTNPLQPMQPVLTPQQPMTNAQIGQLQSQEQLLKLIQELQQKIGQMEKEQKSTGGLQLLAVDRVVTDKEIIKVSTKLATKGDVIYMPAGLFENVFNAKVSFETKQKKIIIKNKDGLVELFFNQSFIELDGKEVKATAKPVMIGDKLMIPLTQVAEFYNAKIRFNDEKNTLIVNDLDVPNNK